MFNKSENIEIHGGAFAHVGGNVNQIYAENVFIQQDSGKRKREPSPDDVADDVNDLAKSGSRSTLPHTKKGRMDGHKGSAQRISDSDKSMLSKLHVAKDSGRVSSKACLEGTRVELLRRIKAWALDPAGERVLLLHGAAGMGKSAVAHTIARQLEFHDDAIVPFFAFNRSVKERSASQLIPTWMKQLAEENFSYLKYLLCLKDDKLQSTDIAEQFDMLNLKKKSNRK
ncbi:hypothetical protein H0H92_004088 [Tricholoma furcatifolium]|nr:hypothetical protein H0H92_004088 [Tricholoma furcatifolium]